MSLDTVGKTWTRSEAGLPIEGEIVEVITPNGAQTLMVLKNGLWFYKDASMYVYFRPLLWRYVDRA